MEREKLMNQPKIIAYLKPSCGWSNGVRAVFKKYDLPFEDRDIINDAANYQEMVAKSGQPLQPTIEIDGKILADVSGEEVEAWLIEKGYVHPSTAPAEAPTNQACQDHPAPTPNITFRRH
jgi:monothiol glutaredoxin